MIPSNKPSAEGCSAAKILSRSGSVIRSAPHGYDVWFDPGMTNLDAASELLQPYDTRLMRCYPISTRINHMANDDEQCSAPVELAEVQNSLFL